MKEFMAQFSMCGYGFDCMTSTNDLIRRMILAHQNSDRGAFNAVVQELVSEAKKKNHHLYARDIERILLNGLAAEGEFHEIPKRAYPYMDAPLDQERGLQLLEVREPRRQLGELVLSPDTREPLDRLLDECKHSDLLASHGIRSCRRILFFGPPGCGKTVAAECIAAELYMPFVVVRFDGIVSSYLGETASNLRRVFEFLRTTPCVALFDEFDAIGKKRTDSEEHGELKRTVNSFLQILDSFVSESIIIAATNHESLLDTAIWRRFDEVIQFLPPSLSEREIILRHLLRHTKLATSAIARAAKGMGGFSHADVERTAIDALKFSILSHDAKFSSKRLFDALARQKKRLESVSGTIRNRSSLKRTSTSKKQVRSKPRK